MSDDHPDTTNGPDTHGPDTDGPDTHGPVGGREPMLRWGAATHQGLVRTENEDAYLAEPMVFAVADGMGGHQAGEVASALAVQTLRERLAGGVSDVDVVVASVIEANDTIFRTAHDNAAQQGMGTTLTAIAVMPDDGEQTTRLALANVGDSRTYRVRNGRLERVTIDHSYVQELVSTGHITEMEARTHPRRNIVTRALGIEPYVRVDSWVLSLVKGDRFVLCSDGLVDEVPDHEIELVAAGLADPQAAADELVAMANRHGGRDNVTVIVLDVLAGIELTPEQLADDALAARTVPAAATTLTMPVVSAGSVDADPSATSSGVDPTSGSSPMAAAAVTGVGAATSGAATAGIGATGTSGPRRRITAGTFVFLFALAAIITVVVVIIAVAANGDDSPAPTVTTVAEVTTTSPTSEVESSLTLPPTTLPPATIEPADTVDIPGTTSAGTSGAGISPTPKPSSATTVPPTTSP